MRFAAAMLACLCVLPATLAVAQEADTATTAPVATAEAVAPDAASPDAAAPAVPAVEKSAEELEIEAMATAFSANLVTMQDEMLAAWPDGDMDAIVAPYRVQATALADRISGFLQARAEGMEPGEARETAEAEAIRARSQVSGLPDTIRHVVLKGLTDQLAAEASGDTPPATAPDAAIPDAAIPDAATPTTATPDALPPPEPEATK